MFCTADNKIAHDAAFGAEKIGQTCFRALVWLLRTGLVELTCSCGGPPQLVHPVLAGAGIGKARPGDQYSAGTIGPKLMAPPAMAIELVSRIEEGASHLVVSHRSYNRVIC
jgi:hypothetical protein